MPVDADVTVTGRPMAGREGGIDPRPMRTTATLIALCLTLLAFTAISQEPTAYEKLAQAGIAEIQAGKLAQGMGSTAEVRAFGAMMVEQHSDANAKLASIANSKGVTLPAAPSEAQINTLKLLHARPGASFDKAYLAEQVRAHEEALRLLKSQIVSGEDAELTAFAQEMLPTVESHLRMAYQLTGQEKKAESMPPPEK
jgi:putative membrane protein